MIVTATSGLEDLSQRVRVVATAVGRPRKGSLCQLFQGVSANCRTVDEVL